MVPSMLRVRDKRTNQKRKMRVFACVLVLQM